VAEVDADLLPSTLEEGTCGAKKRGTLLRYLQDHLEELRPVRAPR
jgi:hypothetical protein